MPGNYRYGEYDGGPDPLAAPFDVREALDEMGDSVLAGGTPGDALRDLLRRGWQERRGLDDLLRQVRERQRELRNRGRLDGMLEQARALLVREGVEQALGGHHAPHHGVDELLQVLRVVGEHVPVLIHEPVEVLLRVIPARVRVQHLAQVREHVLDPLHRLRVRVLQRLLHAAELAVQDLPAQQVAQLVERLPGGLRPPVVVRKLPDRLRRVPRQVVQVGLAQPRLVAWIGEQFGPFLPDRGVEQRASLLQHPVEPAAVAQLALPLADPAHQVIEAAPVLPAAPQQVAERFPRVVTA